MKSDTDPPPRATPTGLLMGLSRRAALQAGFGVVIAILVFASVEAYRIQDTLSERHLHIYREYVKQDAAITQLRRTIWMGGNSVRDFFLSTRPDRVRTLQVQLRQLKPESQESLRQLETLNVLGRIGPGLKSRVEEFWEVIQPISQTMAHATDAEEFEFVQREISPRRVKIYDALRELTEADQKALQRSESEFSATRRAAARRLFLMLGLCVVLGLFVARFSLKYAESLEHKTERQYLEVAEAKRQLQDLSARLLEIEEDGRKRLSRELHDEIGQNLAVLQIEISHALTAAGDRGMVRERLERARELAERTVQTVRNISLLLRPALLDDLGLVPALQWQLEDFIRRSGISCDLSDETVEDGLPDPVKTCVYRVVQEALHNCEKHAHASQIRVLLRQDCGVLMVRIEDNGCGFDLNPKGMPSLAAGLGILGMRERAARIGGALLLDSAPGRGTRLCLTIPVPAGGSAAAAPATIGVAGIR